MKSHFADSTCFDGDDEIDGLGGFSDSGVDGGIGSGIHHVGDGVAEQVDSVVSDEDAGEQGGVIVSGFEAGSADDGDGDADEGGEGGEGIGAVVPRVGVNGGASDFEGEFEDASEENFFDENDAGEDGEGEGCGCVVRGDDFADTARGEEDGGDDEREGDGEGCEGFGFTVSVRMLFVGGFCGEGEAEPDCGGAEKIEAGFDSVGDERVAVAEDTAEYFCGCEEEVGDGTGDGGAGAFAHAFLDGHAQVGGHLPAEDFFTPCGGCDGVRDGGLG